MDPKVVLSLRVGGWANIAIGALHLLMLVRLQWVFDSLGMTADMERVARIHPLLPALMTIAGAGAFFVFGLYALSAAGDLRPLPFTKYVLAGIALVFLARAVGGTGLGGFFEDRNAMELSFSGIAFVVGCAYAVGAFVLFRSEPA